MGNDNKFRVRKIELHPRTLILQLLKRAGSKCEYCKQKINIDNTFYFECDHIHPKSKRGTDDSVNKAVACGRCNLLKSNKTFVTDPLTKIFVPFFSPRTHQWDEHFEISALSGVVFGKTSIGRATAYALQLNTREIDSSYLIGDRDIIASVGHELIADLSLLRKYRLSAHKYFDWVISVGNDLFHSEHVVGSKNKLKVQFFIATQIIEAYFTRSRDVREILEGIKCTRQFAAYFERLDEADFANKLRTYLFTFYKQLAFFYPEAHKLLANLAREKISISAKGDFSLVVRKCKNSLFCEKKHAFDKLTVINSRLPEVNELHQRDPVKFVFTMIDLLDIAKEFPDYFLEQRLTNPSVNK